MEIKAFTLTNEKGNRNPTVCNSIRKQMVAELVKVLGNAGFEVSMAANGDIAIATCTDIATGDIYNTRLTVTFSNKDLDSKVAVKKKEKVAVELPDLFATVAANEAEEVIGDYADASPDSE